MSEDLTTADVAARLDRPERTVRLWCKQGRLPGARPVTTPRGDYWLIPAAALTDFQAPERGRPAKPKPDKAAPSPDGKVGVKKAGKKGGKK
jgi:hypothetical protein